MPTRLFVRTMKDNASNNEKLAEQIVYGEAQTNAVTLNLRGKPFQHFDGAGVVTSFGHNLETDKDEAYDFKGNLLRLADGGLLRRSPITSPSRSR